MSSHVFAKGDKHVPHDGRKKPGLHKAVNLGRDPHFLMSSDFYVAGNQYRCE